MRHILIALMTVPMLAACQPTGQPQATGTDTGQAAKPAAPAGSAGNAAPGSADSKTAPATQPTPAPSATPPQAGKLPAGDPLKTEPGPAQVHQASTCGADKVQSYVGQEATATVRAEVAQKSAAKNIRWITPDTMVTQDFRPDRLNVSLGINNKIDAVNCG